VDLIGALVAADGKEAVGKSAADSDFESREQPLEVPGRTGKYGGGDIVLAISRFNAGAACQPSRRIGSSVRCGCCATQNRGDRITDKVLRGPDRLLRYFRVRSFRFLLSRYLSLFQLLDGLL
jgi:hypothetical protein